MKKSTCFDYLNRRVDMDFATELDPDSEFKRSPYEVGLGWLVNLQADDFVGKKALEAEKDIGNASIYAQYKELTEAFLLVNNCKHRVHLLRGAHINLERRNQIPARIS